MLFMGNEWLAQFLYFFYFIFLTVDRPPVSLLVTAMMY